MTSFSNDQIFLFDVIYTSQLTYNKDLIYLFLMVNSTLGINLIQNFATILIWKIDKGMDKYTKNKN